MFTLIAIPVISALIGWFTNWVAIKMLFHPRHPRRFLFFTFHGIFPKHQAEVAEKIGTMIATELLSPADVRPHLTSADQLEAIHKIVGEKMDDYLNGSFKEKHPILNVLLGGARKAEFKQEVMDEIEFFTPQIIEQVMTKVEANFDVAKIISQRVAELEVDKLEQLLMGILEKEFRFVEWIGGVIGFLIGLLQVVITLL